MLPRTEVSFLGIGAPRSGTTWLAECLKEHPEIFIPEVKETLFLTRYFHKGIDWYRDHFATAKEGQILGEFSTDYLYHQEALERALELNPRMKFIVLLRNPVDRTYSNYLYYHRYGYFKGSFAEALDKHRELIEYSLYGKYLKGFKAVCPDSPLLVLIYEEVIKDPRTAMKQIFDFLGVDSNFIPDSLNTKINTAEAMSFHFPKLVLWYTDSDLFRTTIVRDGSIKNSVRHYLKRIIVYLLRFNESRRQEFNQIEPDKKLELKRLLGDDMAELEQFLGRDIAVWRAE